MICLNNQWGGCLELPSSERFDFLLVIVQSLHFEIGMFTPSGLLTSGSISFWSTGLTLGQEMGECLLLQRMQKSGRALDETWGPPI